MKSKITIDLNEQSKPVVLINYQPSEDVRDKMVKMFLESLTENGKLKLTYSSAGEHNQYSTIEPI